VALAIRGGAKPIGVINNMKPISFIVLLNEILIDSRFVFEAENTHFIE
jgi:hypothetical protein